MGMIRLSDKNSPRPVFPMYKYEKKSGVFRVGDIVHNLNGTDYEVLHCFDEHNLLVRNTLSGELIGTGNINYYDRYDSQASEKERQVQRGVEWDYGVYLGNNLEKIDFNEVRNRLGVEDAELSRRWQELDSKTSGYEPDRSNSDIGIGKISDETTVHIEETKGRAR